MQSVNFDEIIDRRGTDCIKWDGFERYFPGLDTKGCLPMWVADSDFFVPSEVKEAIIEKARQGIFGYPDGNARAFNEALINWLDKRHKWCVDANQIVAVPGVVPAIAYAVQAFSREGDGVIIQPPVYYPFKQTILNNKRIVKENTLLFDGETYSINFEDLEKKAKDPRTKLMILCHPHNPVGRVWVEEELRQIGEICTRNDVLIFSDEIHSDLIFKGFKHIPLVKACEEFEKNIITSYAPSKTFNLAGLKTAAVVITDKEILKRFKAQLSINAAQGVNVFGSAAFIAAYSYGERYLEEMLEYIEGNMDFAKEYIEENIKGAKLISPQGTYLGWVNFNDMNLSQEEINKIVIEKAKVLPDLGVWFGENGKGFLRFNFACPRSVVKKALNQIKQAFND